MLHTLQDDKYEIRQVEINTIASSFSNLSAFTSQLHRYLIDRFNLSDFYLVDQLPQNDTLTSIPSLFAKAFDLYGNKNSVVMMIVHPNETNTFDQRWLEYNLWNNHKIQLIRRSLKDVAETGSVDQNTRELKVGDQAIAIAYYRAGYTPDDYPSKKEWDGRWLIESSCCIKTPNISEHLAGTKKIQQVLAQPGVLESFLPNANDVKKLRSCFAGLYSLSEGDEGVEEIVKKAIEEPHNFVLKPQREGGGNNLYDNQIVEQLSKMTPKQRSAFILMDRIVPPSVPIHTLREGQLNSTLGVSELGIYGLFLSDGDTIVENKAGGHLLRTKVSTVDDGGVAAGVAVLDSPYLV